jgi:hypothetical protein
MAPSGLVCWVEDEHTWPVKARERGILQNRMEFAAGAGYLATFTY